MTKLILLTLLLTNTSNLGQKSPLQVVLKGPNNEKIIHVGESVELTGGFHNSGKVPVWLDGRIVYKVHLHLTVIDEKGNEIAFPGSREKIRLAPPAKDDFTKLAVGATLLRPDITHGSLKFSDPGIYTIRLIGSHGASEIYAKSFGINLGSIGQSDQITIRVVP